MKVSHLFLYSTFPFLLGNSWLYNNVNQVSKIVLLIVRAYPVLDVRIFDSLKDIDTKKVCQVSIWGGGDASHL
jgi:hypothetical protein